MLTAYDGKLGKAEAEWVLAMLTIHGNEAAALAAMNTAYQSARIKIKERDAAVARLQRELLERRSLWRRFCDWRRGETPELSFEDIKACHEAVPLTQFENWVMATTWATQGQWWYDGMQWLREHGKLPA